MGCDDGSSSDSGDDADDTDATSNEKTQERITQASYEPTVEVIVTKDDPSLPAGCEPQQVAGLVTSFFKAFNEGNQKELSRFFVRQSPTPGLYGTSEDRGKSGFGTHKRSELLRYFAERHEHKERLRLLSVDVAKSFRPNAVDISYALTRRADDFETRSDSSNRSAIGKAVIDCNKQMIIIWNMETLEQESLASGYEPCKDPSAGNPDKAVIACAREG